MKNRIIKVLTIIFLSFCFFNYAVAQNSLATKSDTLIKSTNDSNSIINNRNGGKVTIPLWILDNTILYDTLANKALKNIRPDDILDLSIITDTSKVAYYKVKGVNAVWIITTKKFAIKEYEEKLSSFCVDYKKYLKIDSGDDRSLIYFINGNLFGHDDKSILTLFKLPKNNILDVSLSKAKNFEGIESITVIIETKQ